VIIISSDEEDGPKPKDKGKKHAKRRKIIGCP
jgi:hypothetical protein